MSYVNTTPAPQSYLHLASGLSAPDHTFVLWVKALNYGASEGCAAYATVGAAGSVTDSEGIESGVAPNTLAAGNTSVGPEPDIASVVGTDFHGWIFSAFTVDGAGVLKVYIGTETIAPVLFVTGAIAGNVSDVYMAFPVPFGLADQNNKMAASKFWARGMNPSEIYREWRSLAPADATALVSYLSCANGTTVGTATVGANWTVSAAGITTDADMPAPVVPQAMQLA